MKKRYVLLFILSFAMVINTGCTGDQQTILGQASTSTITLTTPTPDEEASQEAPGKEETDNPANAVGDDETEEPAPVPTATEVKPEYTYTITPEMQNFSDCFVSEEELRDGTYWHWLKDEVVPTIEADFKARADQIVDDIPIRTIGLPSGGAFFYPEDNGVYVDEETTAPWNRKVTFAVSNIEYNGETVSLFVLPVFYRDKETHEIYPVVMTMPIYREESIAELIDVYLNDMNMPIIMFSSISAGAFEKETTVINERVNPLVKKVYDDLGQDEYWRRVEAFYQGDYSAFSSPDMVVAANIISSEAFR